MPPTQTCPLASRPSYLAVYLALTHDISNTTRPPLSSQPSWPWISLSRSANAARLTIEKPEILEKSETTLGGLSLTSVS